MCRDKFNEWERESMTAEGRETDFKLGPHPIYLKHGRL